MKSKAIWIEGFQSRLDNDRGHEVLVDLSTCKGGEDIGCSSLELTLMSLAGCITTIFAVVAKKSRFEFDGLEAEVRGVKGNRTIESVDIEVRVKASDPVKAERVLKNTLKTCPVGILFEDAGVKITHNLIVE